jgi:2-iminobutanoate/2-iminopropanoate deaminase
MNREIINTDRAPAAIGPYAQANRVGDFIFTSGQIPLDPATGEVIGTEIKGQASQVLTNLKNLLESAGSSLSDVIKTTVFIKNMGDFAELNAVYAEFFTGDVLPSRSAVEVSRLPKDVLVEIELIAFVKK